MSIPYRHLPVIIVLGFGVAGCAAPIKALMDKSAEAPQAATLAEARSPAAQKEAAEHELIRQGLEKRAAAMRAMLRQKPPETAQVEPPRKLDSGRIDDRPRKAAPAEPAGPSNQVAEMLRRAAHSGEGAGNSASPVPGKPTAARPAPVAAPAPTALAAQFFVKNENRLASQPGSSVAMPAQSPEAPRIRFSSSSTTLDADGNNHLANAIRRMETATGMKLVVVGGLAGAGQPWERMQLASARIETVANHVPPAYRVERRFDPGLEVHDIRLEIMPERH